MSNEYTVARRNLEQLGIEQDKISGALSNSRFLVVAAIHGDDSGVADALNELNKFYACTGLKDLIDSVDLAVPLDEGIKNIRGHLLDGHIVGMTGKPASGKSTILSYLLPTPNILLIDEFWANEDGYRAKVKSLKDWTETFNGALVTACQVDSQFTTYRVHIVNPISRHHNLATRNRGITDELRAFYFEAFEANDNLLYETERVKADFIINSGRIKY